jgi:uncharacterized protein (TIGR03083 family)
MDLRADQFEDLIGAYALDACEPDEVAALDAYVAAHPEVAPEIERLRAAAAALGSAGAVQPPPDLRGRMLHVAAERVIPAAPKDALQAETDRFDALLDSLAEDDLDTITHNGLSIRELVTHLEAIDRAFVDAAETGTHRFIGADEVAEITGAALPERAEESFATTVTRFRRTRADLIALGDRIDPAQRIAGYRSTDTLVIRAFETWTHHDDIRGALGRDEALASPAVMRTMAELAMQSLPLAMVVRRTPRPDRTARFVLSGPGGGEWTVPCGPTATPGAVADVVIHASVVDWCRRFSDRIQPADLRAEIDGDADLARELIDAANAFAGL